MAEPAAVLLSDKGIYIIENYPIEERPKADRLISAFVKLSVVRVIIESIMLIFFVLFMFAWVADIRAVIRGLDVPKILIDYKELPLFMIGITAALLFIVFIVMIIFWIFKEEGIIILPFEVAEGKEMYSGKAISDLVATELQIIKSIANREYEGIESEKINLPKLNPQSETTTFNMAELGTLGVGETSFSISGLLIILKRLFPWGKPGKMITGSLQKFGSVICLVALLPQQESFSWKVCRKFKPSNTIQEEHVISLVRDLSFKIAYDVSKKDIEAKTWLGFKHYIEALDSFQQYKLTGKISYLELARRNCIKAINSELDYKKPFRLFLNLGIAYYERENYQTAEELFRKAAHLKPDYNAFLGLSATLLERNNYDEAIKACDKAIQINRNEADTERKKVSDLYDQKKDREARKAYQNSNEIERQSAAAWHNKGIAFQRQGPLYKDEALKCFDEAIKKNPEDIRLRYYKGIAFALFKSYEDAIKCFDECIKMKPRYGEAFCSKGKALLEEHRNEEALHAFDKALEIEPQNAYYWRLKGMAHQKLGSDAQAKAASDEADKWEYIG